jgi:glycosyltransferase involved in cell wall biosynthesis
MKILLTVHQFFPHYAAGTEVLTYSVARELIRRGHIVRILTGHPSSADLREEDRFDEYDFEGIHVYRFYHSYTPMAGQKSMIEVGYDNRLASKYFEQVLENFKPDVVHFFHLDRLGTGLIEHAAQLGIPCFMTPTDFWAICPTGQLVLGNGSLCSGPSAYAGNCVKHFAQGIQVGLIRVIAEKIPTVGADLFVRFTQKGVFPAYPKRKEVMAMVSRLGTNVARLNQLSGLVVPNGFMKELLIRHGISPHIIIQSAYGIDVTSIEGIERCSIHQSHIRVGFIGTIAPHKGCHLLVNAFLALPRGRAVLKIYGSMEDYPEYSHELKRLAGNNDAIEFCGTFHNSKIGEVFAGLDVLAVPSLWYENTPLVVYSAQAAHCPVLASDLPGISSVIQNELNGLLFDVGNTEALTRQLARLIDEPGLVERLSSNFQQPKSTATYVEELLNIWADA